MEGTPLGSPKADAAEGRTPKGVVVAPGEGSAESHFEVLVQIFRELCELLPLDVSLLTWEVCGMFLQSY